MKNFPFKHNGAEFWYSRSVVCTNYVFCKCYDTWWVLAARRGNKQTNSGKWNVPGGFLDHNETTKGCAMRETFEETGFDAYKHQHAVVLNNVIDSNLVGRQHIIFEFYTNLGKVKTLPSLTSMHNEPDETSNISWIPVQNIDKFQWIVGQKTSILNVFNHHIKHRSFTYWLKDMLVKWTSKL